TKITDPIPVDMVTKVVLLAAATADKTLASPPIYQVGTSCLDNALTWTLFKKYICAYWRAIDRPAARVTDDIRFEMYDISEFQRRFDRRFGDKIRALSQPRLKESKEARRSLNAIAKTKSAIMTYMKFLVDEWFFDVANTLRLDHEAPPELKSHLGQGINWIEYFEDYNRGLVEFILQEKVDRTLIVDYSIKPLELILDTEKGSSSSNSIEELQPKSLARL
ncbi:hypothetical protein BGZ94_007419, partial [Podila epigama]